MAKLDKVYGFFGLKEQPIQDEDDYGTEIEVAGDAPSGHELAHKEIDADFPAPAIVSDDNMHRIVTIRPTSFAESAKIADIMRAGTPIVLSLESVQEREAQRVIDYASGVVQALEGSLGRVAWRVYLLSPKWVKVDSGADKFTKLFG